MKTVSLGLHTYQTRSSGKKIKAPGLPDFMGHSTNNSFSLCSKHPPSSQVLQTQWSNM